MCISLIVGFCLRSTERITLGFGLDILPVEQKFMGNEIKFGYSESLRDDLFW